MEYKHLYSHDNLGLHRAALAFAEDRLEWARKSLDRIAYEHDDRVRRLRVKMMRKQVQDCRTQLAALEALLAMTQEELE